MSLLIAEIATWIEGALHARSARRNFNKMGISDILHSFLGLALKGAANLTRSAGGFRRHGIAGYKTRSRRQT